MVEKKSKSMCSGCRDDFYNCGGATGQTNHCWHYDNAEIVKGIFVGTWENPPYVNKPVVKKLSCYRKERGCFIKLPDQKSRKKTYTMKSW